MSVTVAPTRRVRGRVQPPGDKSISHRYALLAAVANGESTIHGYSTGADCASTLSCLRGLGVGITDLARSVTGLTVRIEGRGLGGLQPPRGVLDAGNSGSTIRMLLGLLAAHPFSVSLTGDASLRRRPMRRVIDPLEAMGAHIDSAKGCSPLDIHGTASLRAVTFHTPVPSAQVKSAVLLAGLHADGRTTVREDLPTRDHTERALQAFGARVSAAPGTVSLDGRQDLVGCDLRVPGDLSSAAFWMVAAAALPESEVVIADVGLNPTRTGILDVIRRSGATVTVSPATDEFSEPRGQVTVGHATLRDVVIEPDDVPGVIDELPVLAALATHGGSLRVIGASELRVKESDRISALASGLRAMGGSVEEFPDGFLVQGTQRLRGGVVDAQHDHRLAMAFAIGGPGGLGPDHDS